MLILRPVTLVCRLLDRLRSAAAMSTLPEIAVNRQTLERHVIELHERARQCESLATQVIENR